MSLRSIVTVSALRRFRLEPPVGEVISLEDLSGSSSSSSSSVLSGSETFVCFFVRLADFGGSYFASSKPVKVHRIYHTYSIYNIFIINLLLHILYK